MSQDTVRRSNIGIIVVLFVLVAVLFIWAISSARRANTMAEANEQRLSVPRLDVIYTVGGPQRFAEEFTSALEGSDTAEDPLATEDLLWAALLIDNDGFVDVNDVMLTVPLADGLTPTVVAEVGGFAGIEVESTDTGLSLDLGDVRYGETIYVFLGFDPEALADNVADSWGTSFEVTVGTISAKTDRSEDNFYGTAQ